MPADAAEIVRLAERVEQATGPDRELDCLIYAAANIPHERSCCIDIKPPYVGWHPVDGPYVSAVEAPRYTASLDAAMTLVPESWNFEVDRIAGRGGAVVNRSVLSRDAVISDAATPALALTAAALRARAAQHDHEVG